MVPFPADMPIRGYDLVVVGSSAGGIEALSTLVTTLPPDFAASLVIAQHLDPHYVSHLGEILARHTTLPVHSVTEQETLVPGTIYVVPADRDVEINDHEVVLFPHPEHPSIPSVNRLFSSAARTHGENLIGVILTGAGSDGASGARDVKLCGGTVIIENPTTAAYSSMPQSLSPSSVDFVLDIAQIGPLLQQLVAGEYTPSSVESDATLPVLLEHIRVRTGIDFSTYKPATILRRLQRRMVITQMHTIADYIQYISENPEEFHLLTSSLLIKVTEFFRDPELFAALRDDILPNIIAQARTDGKSLRFWSAGCSTGEEAYSLAILLAEMLGDNMDSVSIRIFATDVDQDVIAFARRGIYPPSALATLPAETVERAFTPIDGAYEIIPAIRNLVIFGQHDLGVRAPFPQIDMVLCRNVLIYFTPELQRRTLQLFAFAIHDGGYLVLGKAETPAPFLAYFAPVLASLKLYRRQGVRVLVPPPRLANQPLFIAPQLPSRRTTSASPRLPQIGGGMSSSNEYIGSLLIQSSVGVIVVDRQYDIQSINLAGQQLLGIFRSALGEDIIHLLMTEIAQPLRAAIDATFAQQKSHMITITTSTAMVPHVLQIITTAATNVVLLQITDMTNPQSENGNLAQGDQHLATLAKKTVESHGILQQDQSPIDTQGQKISEKMDLLTQQLDAMTSANTTLRRANDKVAQINVTVTGLNEDLMVRNEEFQASTEEIKTLNEELQATNEELETLNEEMEATVEELRATNDDLIARTNEVQHLAALREEQRQLSASKAVELEAILLSMGDALLVLNVAGEVVLTNASYVTFFGTDRFDWTAEDENGQVIPFDETLQQRVKAGKPFRQIFTQSLSEGKRRWLEATCEPIRLNEVVTGMVMTVRDVSDQSLQRLQDEFLALASHEFRTPLTSMKMATQMLERKLKTAEDPVMVLLATLVRQIKQLQQLTDDLANVSRLKHMKLHFALLPIDLHEVVTNSITAFAIAMPNPPIVFEGKEHLMIQGDVGRLEQILTNLLTNASKYAANSPQVVVRLRQRNQQAELEVQDYGPGIEAKDLPNLFQRFYQIDNAAASARSGLGLGLYLSRELVKAQGGEITVASQVGKGTTFTIRFPLLSV